MNLKIVEKVLIGFIVGSTIPVILGVFSLVTLISLNNMNKELIENKGPVIKITDDLIDTLLAQELYGSRYLLSKKNGMRILFRQRSVEFGKLLSQANNLPGEKNPLLSKIATLHLEYNELFSERFSLTKKTSNKKKEELNYEIVKKQESILSTINDLSVQAYGDHDKITRLIAKTVDHAFVNTVSLCMLGIIVGIVAAVLITKNVSGSIDKLKTATRRISEGQFDHVPEIKQGDELWELATEFKYMGSRLRQLEALHLDASPLTKLPGGVAIEKMLEERINKKSPTTFCLIDLDNFKAYNDHYGYSKGNELIKASALIIKDVVTKLGEMSDFVGHIGGDDFAVITKPEYNKKICMEIIDKFDKRVPSFYNSEDRKRGYIMGKTRQGENTSFPFVSLSVAAVSNEKRKFESYIELGEIVAELKEAAKKIPGSSYVEDRRTHNSATL
ncbi:MAG: sensor domain-containing diguanylate cyclase [Deltaproteobacteria bacterium]|nr:sensor domain-containing diguanylate cyclase [Deltaproteobacteria bacterium]